MVVLFYKVGLFINGNYYYRMLKNKVIISILESNLYGIGMFGVINVFLI